MSKTDYRKALDSARAEFEKLLQERAGLDSRIVRLKQTIAGLTSLCNGNDDTRRALSKIVPLPPRFMRLTSAIRQLLAESTSPMRPPDVRTSLADQGFNLSQYANKLAVIHNTLSRLEKQGEAMQVSGGWVLTDKGKLASRLDSLDFPSPVDIESPQRKAIDCRRANKE
jgi:hypothetical protein